MPSLRSAGDASACLSRRRAKPSFISSFGSADSIRSGCNLRTWKEKLVVKVSPDESLAQAIAGEANASGSGFRNFRLSGLLAAAEPQIAQL